MKRIAIAFCLLLFLALPVYAQEYDYVAGSGGAAAAASLKVATGSYTGNSSDDRAVVSGLTFTPKVVLICADVAVACAIRTDSMSGDLTSIVTGGGGADLIQSITSDGFTVGTANNVNYTGWDYRWVAIGGTEAATGTYTGNGSDNRGITGAGFQPGFVMVVPSAAQSRVLSLRGTNTTGDNSFLMNAAMAANIIQSLDVDGFTLGTHVNVNEDTSAYYWWAVSSTSTSLGQDKYTGNSADDRDISTSFSPLLVINKMEYAEEGTVRNSAYSGDATKTFSAEGVKTNQIQSLGTNLFQVGSDTYINLNNYVYYYWYFRQTP